MAPAALELFKFTLYVFCPVYAMLHFGDPDFYETYVDPLRAYYTQADKKQVAAPQTTEELKSELARLRNERIAKRDSRLGITTPAVAVGAESKVLAELNKGKKDESNERMV